MNRTKIEWVKNDDGSQGFTWNPIVGCKHNCWYCYARKIAARGMNGCPKCKTFEPHTHFERLDQPQKRKKPTTIFVGSMCDMWGEWVPPAWIEDVLCATYWKDADVESEEPSPHRYLMLTKNPKRYQEFHEMIPENMWCGATITGKSDLWGSLDSLSRIHSKTFVSFEPLLHDITEDVLIRFAREHKELFFKSLNWLIIGPLNVPGHDPVTKREWVERLMAIGKDAGVPIFLKNACIKIGFTEAEVKANQNVPWINR